MGVQTTAKSSGFTLVETLVVIAIIMVTAGIVYAGLAPVREKGRETHCWNNLHQIGRAIQMYRQDYGGQDPPGALTIYQLGLPRNRFALRPYLRNSGVFDCPSENWAPGDRGRMASYMWHMLPDEMAAPPVPPFSRRVAERGEQTPLVSDPHHGMNAVLRSHLGQPGKVLILRLSGEVHRGFVPPTRPSWEW